MFDAFDNDWLNLGDEMSSIGGPGDLHLKEYQSFTDIHNSKGKVVTCVQWHPTFKGVIAMSLAANYSLYDRLDNLAKSVISPSLILIWSFVDPIQPKLLLEAPDDIFSFAFSPTEPNVIAGGCLNGQVVLWDIGPWEERIKNPRADHRDKDLFIVRPT
jgi:WD40 repeat protein